MREIDYEWITIDECFKKHTPYIWYQVKFFTKQGKKIGLEPDDLFGAGAIGLTKAYHRFDQSKGYKFITYASMMVRGEIQLHLRSYDGMVSFPRSIKDLATKITQQDLWPEPDKNIAAIMDEEHERVSYARLFKTDVRNLESKINGDDDQITYMDKVGAEDDTTVIHVKEFFEQLPEREVRMLEKTMEGYGQRVIGKAIGVSQPHVARLMKKVKQRYEGYETSRQEEIV